MTVLQTEGHLSLALLAESLPSNLVLAVLPPFRRQYPQIRFTVTFDSLPRIEEGLIAERINFALVDRTVESEFVEMLACGTLDYVAVASQQYTADFGPFDSIEKVLLADLIDLGSHMPLTRRWAEAGHADAATLVAHVKPAFVIPNFQAALTIMLGHAGIAFLPRLLVAPALAAGEAVELTPTLKMPPKPLQLLYRRRSARQLVESLFLEYLVSLGPLATAAE